MPLSSTSTNAEVYAQYDDNVTYDIDGNATKAYAFIEATRIMLRRGIKKVKQGDSEIEVDLSFVKEQLKAAMSWWDSQDGRRSSGSVRFLGVSPDFRG